MKNLLLILAFVSISLTGFSQTFSLSSGTPGQTQQTFIVSIPQGNGYYYSYNTIATNSTIVIASYYKGTLAWLSNPTPNQKQSSGSGNVSSGAGGSSQQKQDNIVIIIANGASYCYGYAQITVNPY